MSLDSNSLYFAIISFILLLFASYYYLTKRHLWEGKIGLVVISYVQGMILGILNNVDNVFVLFSTAVVFGVLYYLLFSKLILLFEFAKNRILGKFIAHDDPELTETMIRLSGLPREQIKISIFAGENSCNAFTALSPKTSNIYVGEKLLEFLTKNELIFVLSHEIAHRKKWWFILIFGFFPLVYLFFCLIAIVIITAFGFLSVPLYFFLSIVYYLAGIIILNRLSWYSEYSADREGLRISQDLGSAQSMLQKFNETQQDHGYLNLVFYDHPPLHKRIENLRSY
jgi:Zn-dependent protease with chaperone function